VLRESLQKWSSAATVLIWAFLGLLSVRFMRSRRDAAVFFRSVAKDPDPTKQKSYGYLTCGGSEPRKADFRPCSLIFRLSGGSSALEDLLEVAIPGKHVFRLDGAHRIAGDIARDCQETLKNYLCIKRLLKTYCPAAEVGIHLDIGNSSVAIPTESSRKLVLYS
jgi:hypothetical protein